MLAKGQNSVLSPDLGVFLTSSQISLKDLPWVQERHFVTELTAIKFFLFEKRQKLKASRKPLVLDKVKELNPNLFCSKKKKKSVVETI